MKLQNTKLGFTLIELLVVITIIGILATGAVSVYTSQIQKARDTTRVTSLAALQGGIEQFYQDTYEYPIGGKDWSGSGGVQAYIPKLTQDPKHDQTCINSRCGYVYAVGTDLNGITNGAYEISTAFENKGNVDNKAVDTTDNGNDPSRLELGVPADPVLATDQLQSDGFAGAALAESDNTTDVLVIVNGGAVTK